MDGLLGPELWKLRREDLLREAEADRLARTATSASSRGSLGQRALQVVLRVAGRSWPGPVTGDRGVVVQAARLGPIPTDDAVRRRVPAGTRRCARKAAA